MSIMNNSHDSTPFLRAAEQNLLLGQHEEDDNNNNNRSSPIRSWAANILHTIWVLIASSKVNILLVFVPLGIIAGNKSESFGNGGKGGEGGRDSHAWNPTPSTVFILNFLAVVPLSVLLTFVVDELANEMRRPWRELFKEMFTVPLKMIVNVVAVIHSEIRVVQSCMLGTILSNILLILGCCFVAGGIRSQESNFNTTAASTMSSLMVIASVSLIVPATLDSALRNSESGSGEKILILSRGAAVILLLLYALYLFFRLHSHSSLFTTPVVEHEESRSEGEEEIEEAQSSNQLSPLALIIALKVILVAITSNAHFLIRSIQPIILSTHTNISRTFIGLILLPILGNGKDRARAISAAYHHNNMTTAIDVAIGSSIHIALFVTPFLVILSWGFQHTMGEDAKPMTLHFQGFETVVFFVSVLVVNSLIQDGKSNYLEGAMCLGTYIIIAIAFRLYPDDAGDLGALVGSGISGFR